MNETVTSAELERRLDTIENRIEEKRRQLEKGNVPTELGTQRAGEIRGKSSDIRHKMESNTGSAWQAVKDEVARDVEALEQDFDHWVRYVDRHFQE